MKKKSLTTKSSQVRKVIRTKNKPLTNKAGQVRELTGPDIRSMQSASDVLPAKLLAVLPQRKRGERGPQKAPKKESVTMRYSPEVVEYFKSTGPGWQTRVNRVLKEYIKSHPKS